jgi:formylglycine-generating enzyme
MRKLLCLAVVIASLTTICSAQTMTTQTFGTGVNSFSMDFVEIGNPGNAADTTGSPNPVGSVAYTYNIGKYEVSRDMITKANAASSLGITMYDLTSYGGNLVNRPATGISWKEAAKYVNWLNTSTGNTPAYPTQRIG